MTKNLVFHVKGTEKKTWDSLPAKTRNMIRKGQKNLTITEGYRYIYHFYAMYIWLMLKKGVHPYSLKHFTRLKKTFGKGMKVIVALYKRKVVGATVLLIGKRAFYPYQVSTDNTYSPNSFMVWECMKICIKNDISLLDMGDSTIGSGTYIFKKNLGGRIE